MPVWIGYIISFFGGGLMGALLTRIFTLQDRAIQKLTLKAVKEEIKSLVPVSIDNRTYTNLIHKEFELLNRTNKDFDDLKIIFGFDPESVIVFEETESKLGKNKCGIEKTKPNECCYQINNFNRKQKVTFKFRVAGITNNFFSAVTDKKGVEIDIIALKTVDKPSISPGKFVSKIIIEK